VRRHFFSAPKVTAEDAPDCLTTPPSWAELETRLAEVTTPEEEAALKSSKDGRGNLRADSSDLRLFGDDTPDQVRVTLYRDHASWCPYCEKVQIALEEKEVSYRISKVAMNCYGDKPFEFLAKNPMGLLPVAELDGSLITESNSILDTMESAFADKKALIPAQREKDVQFLLRLERQLFGSWFQWLRSDRGDTTLRDRFCQDLAIVEECLAQSDGPLFLGSEITMVDCHFASFLERMAGSLAYFKGFQMRRNRDYPNVEAWFQFMETQPSYVSLAGDFYTHAHDLPPQVGGCAENRENTKCKRAIDGIGDDGKGIAPGWNLPLPDGEPTPLEPLLLNTPAESEAARREAARKLVCNRSAVLKFCLRAKGSPGFPPVMAPLADPRASPSGDEQLADAVDEALRGVAKHLLWKEGAAVDQAGVGPLAWSRREDLRPCLEYLRDRVGVPRDMSFPAARQFRAHLNSYLQATFA